MKESKFWSRIAKGEFHKIKVHAGHYGPAVKINGCDYQIDGDFLGNIVDQNENCEEPARTKYIDSLPLDYFGMFRYYCNEFVFVHKSQVKL